MSEYHLALPDGERIPYQLERRPRRTIGLKIGSNGLVVHAPRRITQTALESALLDKAGWIRKKLQQMAASRPAPIRWEDGAALKLLGNDIRLSLRQDTRNRKVTFEQGALHVRLTDIGDSEAIVARVVQWYKKEALADFERRLQLYAARLGVPMPKLYLSNARSRWGSCNSRSEIRLNWRLLQAPPHLINYVVCHELAHLKEMNHSARFWAVVESLYPDYRSAERTLKQRSAELHQF